MGLEALIAPFPWGRYSKKLAFKIEKAHNIGFFTQEESQARGMRLVIGRGGDVRDGNGLALFWLVDKEDGTIVDACFQALGQSVLIGAAEIACDLLIGKNYDQAKRMNSDLIDKHVRDRSDEPAFPVEAAPHLNLVLEAIEEAAEQCSDLPLAAQYVAPPAPLHLGEVLEGGYPGWDNLSKKQKLAVIEEVMNNDIRPYIALDGGGVTLVDLVNETQLLIAYQGNCTSCFASVGATLSYIQQVVQARVHPDLRVQPT